MWYSVHNSFLIVVQFIIIIFKSLWSFQYKYKEKKKNNSIENGNKSKPVFIMDFQWGKV